MVSSVASPLVSLADIRDAAVRVSPILRQTPVEHLHSISSLVGREIWVKEEQLQRTGSYKIRGAFNMISRLPPASRVVAASSGNHAQAVALACALADHPCKIYMPVRSSILKFETTEAYGAEVIGVDGDLDRCTELALAQCDGTTEFVPVFDHRQIIAGHGTLGLELASELPADIETVVLPVGGGGLIAGVAAALKALRPNIGVVGVEAAAAPAMTRALREGRPVVLDDVSTLADAIANRMVSQLTLNHVRELVDDMVLVTEGEITHALLVLLDRAKAVIEPGAATALGAIMSGEVVGNGPACVVLSGGNVDPVLLVKLIDHGLTSSGRYVVMRVLMPDTPGHLSRITTAIADMNMNVVDIEHQRTGHFVNADQVQLALTLESRSRSQQDEMASVLIEAGYTVDILG